MISISVLDEAVGGQVTLRVAGDVDADGAARLYEALAAPDTAASAVALDLAGVRSLSASGVSVLLAARAVLWYRQIPLRVTGRNEMVDAVLEGIGGVDRLAVYLASGPRPVAGVPRSVRIRSAIVSLRTWLGGSVFGCRQMDAHRLDG